MVLTKKLAKGREYHGRNAPHPGEFSSHLLDRRKMGDDEKDRSSRRDKKLCMYQVSRKIGMKEVLWSLSRLSFAAGTVAYIGDLTLQKRHWMPYCRSQMKMNEDNPDHKTRKNLSSRLSRFDRRMASVFAGPSGDAVQGRQR
jgi:hypothetical protein